MPLCVMQYSSRAPVKIYIYKQIYFAGAPSLFIQMFSTLKMPVKSFFIFECYLQGQVHILGLLITAS